MTFSPNARSIMVSPGMTEERVVHGVRVIRPSRFHDEERDGSGDMYTDDCIGWVWWEGKKTPVQTAYWGGVIVWEFTENEVEVNANRDSEGRLPPTPIYVVAGVDVPDAWHAQVVKR